MTILRTENITKSYGDKTVIEDISIRLEEGELVSLLGVSGAGKSTLFNIISGLTVPDRGRVLLMDREEKLCGEAETKSQDPIAGLTDITGAPGKIAYMLQKDMLLPHKKVIDNVALPLFLKGMKKKDARQKAESFFEAFGLDGTQYKYPSQLSGGMKQRAALLRTYMASGGIVLLDEPFSALDTITKSAMHRWYLDVMEHISLSTLFITHDIDEAILLSDRIYILGGTPGHILEEIEIHEGKPRHGEFMLSQVFLEYKRRTLKAIEQL